MIIFDSGMIIFGGIFTNLGFWEFLGIDDPIWGYIITFGGSPLSVHNVKSTKNLGISKTKRLLLGNARVFKAS